MVETEDKGDEIKIYGEMDSEGIKLQKNSRGYNWTIKIKNFDIEALAKLDDKMTKLFGNK